MTSQSFNFLGLFLSIALLSALSYLLNQQLERAEASGVEGWTWAFVVAGVGGVLIVGGFHIGWDNVLWLLMLFAAAGWQMALGEIRRHHAKWRHFMHTLGLSHDESDSAAPTRKSSAPDDPRH